MTPEEFKKVCDIYDSIKIELEIKSSAEQKTVEDIFKTLGIKCLVIDVQKSFDCFGDADQMKIMKTSKMPYDLVSVNRHMKRVSLLYLDCNSSGFVTNHRFAFHYMDLMLCDFPTEYIEPEKFIARRFDQNDLAGFIFKE